MKAASPCIPCALAQAHEIASRLTSNETERREMLRRAAAVVAAGPDYDVSPAELTHAILRPVLDLKPDCDPYLKDKRHFNDLLMARLPELREKIAACPDRLRAALRLSIAGNVIDLGIFREVDALGTIEKVFDRDFAIDDYASLREKLAVAERVVYLLDNAGEIVLDRLLIEEIGPERVTAIVREAPILNDVTLDDAKQTGLIDLVPVVPNGSDVLGTPLTRVSERVRTLLGEADVIVAKGQANFETIGGAGLPIFYVLMAKCPLVAVALGCRLGDLVLKSEPNTLA